MNTFGGVYLESGRSRNIFFPDVLWSVSAYESKLM